jgi:hypothetical protein
MSAEHCFDSVARSAASGGPHPAAVHLGSGLAIPHVGDLAQKVRAQVLPSPSCYYMLCAPTVSKTNP